MSRGPSSRARADSSGLHHTYLRWHDLGLCSSILRGVLLPTLTSSIGGYVSSDLSSDPWTRCLRLAALELGSSKVSSNLYMIGV